jgi:hypothetical protein
MVRFVDLRIRVQPWVVHDAINEIIDDGGNRIHAAQSFIERLSHG